MSLTMSKDIVTNKETYVLSSLLGLSFQQSGSPHCLSITETEILPS